MRDKHIKAQFAEHAADVERLRKSVQDHATKDSVDAAHAVAKGADDKIEALRAELDAVKAEFAGLRESVRQAAGLAVAPASEPAPQDEPVTPITRPRARRASSS